ncbi:sensor histidine kinase [Gammaproteobacteria bacterium]|nr:sensor histidine kinase [Gammaproteobacteria bacterium]
MKGSKHKGNGLVVNSTLNQQTKKRSYISPITRRILAINVLALALLVIGLLYVGQYREELIDSEIGALNVQAELFAAALGEAAVGEDDYNQALVFEDANQIVRRMIATTGTVAQLVMPNGNVLIDSRLYRGPISNVQVRELPPPKLENTLGQEVNEYFENFLRQFPLNTKRYLDTITITNIALKGDRGVAINTLADGKLKLSVAVPVQRYKRILGALLLTKDGAKIDKTVFQVRLDILRVFSVVLFVTILLSMYLASSIARPLKKLAIAIENIRKGKSQHYDIADILIRPDEIGELGNMLNDMTEALWRRMEAIERFAADVSHEIKNPLTSLRSAIETMASLDSPKKQNQLMKIILDDIERLDRLISDISDASRLDSELSRVKMAPVELISLLNNLIGIYDIADDKNNIQFKLINKVEGLIVIQGVEDRIVQVLRNLISNAISFSPANGTIFLNIGFKDGIVKIDVIDEGPGLQSGTEERVFDRFYKERPENEKFGIHSGLGLSISQQIIIAHGGNIRANNLLNNTGQILGACFTVEVPKGY